MKWVKGLPNLVFITTDMYFHPNNFLKKIHENQLKSTLIYLYRFCVNI